MLHGNWPKLLLMVRGHDVSDAGRQRGGNTKKKAHHTSFEVEQPRKQAPAHLTRQPEHVSGCVRLLGGMYGELSPTCCVPQGYSEHTHTHRLALSRRVSSSCTDQNSFSRVRRCRVPVLSLHTIADRLLRGTESCSMGHFHGLLVYCSSRHPLSGVLMWNRCRLITIQFFPHFVSPHSHPLYNNHEA